MVRTTKFIFRLKLSDLTFKSYMALNFFKKCLKHTHTQTDTIQLVEDSHLTTGVLKIIVHKMKIVGKIMIVGIMKIVGKKYYRQNNNCRQLKICRQNYNCRQNENSWKKIIIDKIMIVDKIAI